MSAHRKEWVCCVCDSEGGHHYNNAQDIEEHARNWHSDLVEDSQTSQFAALCEMAPDVINPNDCPLCEDWGLAIRARQTHINFEGSVTDLVVTPARYARHVGNHLEQIALFALPRQQVEEDLSRDGSAVAAAGQDSEASNDTASDAEASSDEEEETSTVDASANPQDHSGASIISGDPAGKSTSELQESTQEIIDARHGFGVIGLVFNAFDKLITGIHSFRLRTVAFKSWKKLRHDLQVIQDRLETQRNLFSESAKAILWDIVQNELDLEALLKDATGAEWDEGFYDETLLEMLGESEYWHVVRLLGVLFSHILQCAQVLNINVTGEVGILEYTVCVCDLY